MGILAVAVVVAIAMPLLNTLVIYPAYTSMLVNTIEGEAKRLATHTIPPTLKHSTFTHESLDSHRFYADIYRLENDLGLLKVKVYSSLGVVLYSTDSKEIDTLNTKAEFKNIVAKGNAFSELVETSRSGAGDHTVTLDVIETYVPIMKTGRFLGALELYFDVTEAKQELDRFNRYATIAVSLISLLLLNVVFILIGMESARKKSEQEAEELRNDVERITRHDLKTPLISALNGIQYLDQYTDLDTDQREMLSDMRVAMNTGMDMINRSLDLYKIETGKYDYRAEPVDILATTRRVVADLQGFANSMGVPLELTFLDQSLDGSDSLIIQAEETLCYSVLANLVKNAIEASKTNDVVAIRIDNSIGMDITIHNTQPVPESIQNTFFDKYSTVGKRTGTGLGTYSARLMTQVMGGTIAMISDQKTGTTITVTLPDNV